MKVYLKILLFFLISITNKTLYSQCAPACTLNNIGVSRWWGDGDDQNSIPDATNDDEDGDDFIAFKNFGTTSVNISGWQLYTDRANQAGVNPVFYISFGNNFKSGTGSHSCCSVEWIRCSR